MVKLSQIFHLFVISSFKISFVLSQFVYQIKFIQDGSILSVAVKVCKIDSEPSEMQGFLEEARMFPFFSFINSNEFLINEIIFFF